MYTHSQEWSISNFSCRNITSNTMKNLAFHSLLRRNIYFRFSLHHLYISISKVGRMYIFELGSERLNSGLARIGYLTHKRPLLYLTGPCSLVCSFICQNYFVVVILTATPTSFFPPFVQIGPCPYLGLRRKPTGETHLPGLACRPRKWVLYCEEGTEKCTTQPRQQAVLSVRCALRWTSCNYSDHSSACQGKSTLVAS